MRYSKLQMDINSDVGISKVDFRGVTPPKCYQLSSCEYKQQFYFFGGTSIPANSLNLPTNVLHVFSPSRNTFTKCQGKNKTILPSMLLSSQACTICRNSLYCFGGSGPDKVCSNGLYEFRFEAQVWIKIEGEGAWPSAREGATLFSYLDSFLILFGGVNLKEKKCFDTYWVFFLQTKEWVEMDILNIPPRTQQAVCSFKNRLFLFGGQWKESDQELIKIQYYSDFYELQLKLKKGKYGENIPTLAARKIQERDDVQMPQGRSGHKLIPLDKNKVILIGGEGQCLDRPQCFKTFNDIWIYDTIAQLWLKLELDASFPPVCEFACQRLHNSIYIYGGLTSYDSINEHIYELKLDMELINDKLFAQKHKKWETCSLCYEICKNKNEHMEPAFKLNENMASELIEDLHHPFFAIGLFCDNAVNFNATYLKIIYSGYKGKSMLIFQDDGRMHIDNVEFEDLLVNVEGGINLDYTSTQKRARHMIHKDLIKKQYGANIKLGGLRLGQQILNISICPSQEARIFYFTYELDEYVSYYYVYDLKKKKILEDYSPAIEEHIMSKFGDMITKFFSNYLNETEAIKTMPFRNATICFGLKEKDNGHCELIPNQLYTDVMYITNDQLLMELRQSKSQVLKSIDISLETYLTMLYLKNQHTKISLEVMSPNLLYQPFKKIIINQEILDGIDELIRKNHVYQIDACLNFEFKIMELYLNPDLTKQMNIFHNGVLLYYRNRLIKRFNVQIGMLLDEIDLSTKPDKHFQFFNMFGVLELPDSLCINTIKTDFIQFMMLQKFYSRLNFISHWFSENFDASFKTKIGFPKRNREIMKGIKMEQKQVPSKKIKSNNEKDEEYEDFGDMEGLDFDDDDSN